MHTNENDIYCLGCNNNPKSVQDLRLQFIFMGVLHTILK